MPRYHFHVHDGVSHPDDEGHELPNLSTARSEAVRLAAALLAETAEEVWRDGEWRLEVTDDAGRPAFALRFLVDDPTRVPRDDREAKRRIASHAPALRVV